MLLHGFTDRREDNTLLCQFLFKGGFYRNRVHNSIYSHATQYQTFFKRYAQLVESLLQFWIQFLVGGFLCHWIGIIRNVLIIDFG